MLVPILVAKFALLFLLLGLSGFFSGSEAALFSLSRVERHKIGVQAERPSVRWMRDLLREPRNLLATILVGNELVNVSASVLAASLTDDLLKSAALVRLADDVLLKTLLSSLLFAPLLLILGEVTPKTLAMWNARRFAGFVSFPLRVFHGIVGPVRWVLKGAADGIVRALLGEPSRTEPPMTEEEFRALVDLSREGGALRESEREIIHNIFDFGETRVEEVMTPRTDVFCLPVRAPLDEIVRAIGQRHHSRIPVYDQDKDDVVGILYAKDLLRLWLDPKLRESFDLRRLLRKPYFVPRTKRANDLFREFRSSRIHMAIVVDEYGGVAGLVTMEDLLESLFGEIQDEYDAVPCDVRPLDGGGMIVSARMPIEDFNRRFGAALPDEEYDTLGGLVFDLFGRLPEPGAEVDFQGWTFAVEKIRGTRILEVRVKEQEGEAPPAVEAQPNGIAGTNRPEES